MSISNPLANGLTDTYQHYRGSMERRGNHCLVAEIIGVAVEIIRVVVEIIGVVAEIIGVVVEIVGVVVEIVGVVTEIIGGVVENRLIFVICY